MSDKYQLTVQYFEICISPNQEKKIRDLVNLTLWEVLRIINLDFPHGIV